MNPGRTSITFRWALSIGIAAILLRAIVFLVISHRHHLSVDQYANLYDGHSYLITASAMLGDWSGFNAFHGRVFPAYPAMIAAAHLLGVPMAHAALGIDWMCAGLAAALAGVLFDDRRVGLAMACLIPHYLMNSTMAMTEAPLLAVTLAGLLLARRSPLGGALLGWAGLIRPMACFAAAGQVVLDLVRGGRRFAIHFSLAAIVIVAAGIAALQLWRGDALAGLKAQETIAYAGHPFAWPFQSLLTTPAIVHASPWRMAYVWIHVGIVLAACVVVTARLITRPIADSRDLLAAPWLLGNTAFVLCVGNVWGFECFHRFIVPALPALFWVSRRALPRRLPLWIVIAAGSALIASLSA